VPADLVDLDDSRVIDVGGGLRFVEKPLEDVSLPAQLGEQLLDSRAAPEAEVDPDVDHAHAALAQNALDTIRPDL